MKIVPMMICGGGARNDALMNLLKAKSQYFFKNAIGITTSESAGIDPQLVEGLAFA
ncbi:anhydro-N-acetylmuramic acid kinase [Polynucleobacter necessarius]|uniref:anhydro-N-acetylmuramic acid kinase n=1 Tax=Polynucleobacter necessarius TaxID=576610 RepID=UPI0022B2583B|nr:anhydro-N-acetylmuramic acid kinase [Polynucleobacter necessarius]